MTHDDLADTLITQQDKEKITMNEKDHKALASLNYILGVIDGILSSQVGRHEVAEAVHKEASELASYIKGEKDKLSHPLF